jgi:hypothetical protein
MRGYELSNRRAQALDQLVAGGAFKSPQAAISYAVDNLGWAVFHALTSLILTDG